jgi:hypothetical protein
LKREAKYESHSVRKLDKSRKNKKIVDSGNKIERHREVQEFVRLECAYCNKTFKTENGLQWHLEYNTKCQLY